MAAGLQKIIQSMLIYIVIVSVLRGLISNPKFGQYFQFFSGIILVLLLISPVLSFFHCEDDWYAYLEKNIMQLDTEQIAGDMKIADKHFETMAASQYQMAIEGQVMSLAEQNDAKLDEVEVTIEKNEDTWKVTSVYGQAEDEKQAIRLQRKIADYLVIEKEQVHLWR